MEPFFRVEGSNIMPIDGTIFLEFIIMMGMVVPCEMGFLSKLIEALLGFPPAQPNQSRPKPIPETPADSHWKPQTPNTPFQSLLPHRDPNGKAFPPENFDGNQTGT